MTAIEAIEVAIDLLTRTPEESAVFKPAFLAELRRALWTAHKAIERANTESYRRLCAKICAEKGHTREHRRSRCTRCGSPPRPPTMKQRLARKWWIQQ